MFRQPSSHSSSTRGLCCRVQENGFVSLISALTLSDRLIKLASDAEDFNCKWVFSRIFFIADHICEAELGPGTHSHGTACMSLSMVA